MSEFPEFRLKDAWKDMFTMRPLGREGITDKSNAVVEFTIQMNETTEEDATPCVWLDMDQFLVFAKAVQELAEDVMFSQLRTMGGEKD